MTDIPDVQVARDLRTIETLHGALLVQAIHKARARIDGTSLPGGNAMVALAPVGSPDEQAEQVEAAEHRHLAICPKLDHTTCRYAETAEDEDDEPPLQTLVYWAERWRGYPLGRRPTITTEVNFLRGTLDWARENEPYWATFVKDVSTARTRLENLLLAGERAERGVPCMYDACRGVRLVRKLVPKRNELGKKSWHYSDWHCPRCKRAWDEDRYAAMVVAANERAKFEDIDGVTWCSIEYAARRVDRSVKVIEKWARDDVATVCIVAGKRGRFVNLQEVEDRDATTPRRNSAA